METFDFTEDLAMELTLSTEEFPVDFDVAWQWLKYSSKSHAKDNFMKCNAVKDLDYKVFTQYRENSNGGRPTEKILLSVDCFKMWAMMANTSQGLEVRKYFLKCEKIAKAKKVEENPRLAPAREARQIAFDIRDIQDTLYEQPKLAQILIDFAISGVMEKNALSMVNLRGVAEVAAELGLPVNEKNRSSLGRFVKSKISQIPKKEKRLVNSQMLSVNVFEDTEELRELIKKYFS